MVKTLSIIGSTGSIGTQTLEVIRDLNRNGEKIKIIGLSASRNVNLLIAQAREFKVPYLCIGNQDDADYIYRELEDLGPVIYTGNEGLSKLASKSVDLLLTAVVGMVGLIPTIRAIEAGNNIALANKETLVSAGEIVMNLAREKKVNIFPVDSEHSGVLQCINGEDANNIKKIILTGSGGPFRTRTKEELDHVSVEEALRHPTWNMGGKISIDSASLMNKGLEVIEAMHLFSMPVDKIDVVIHPQSIVHSMVCYKDNSVIAQLGPTSMKIPIQYALTYPERKNTEVQALSLTDIGNLSFEKPDFDKFPALAYAYEAARVGGTMPSAMNAANEVCVDSFLKGRISFNMISKITRQVMDKHQVMECDNIEKILKADKEAREMTGGIIDDHSY